MSGQFAKRSATDSPRSRTEIRVAFLGVGLLLSALGTTTVMLQSSLSVPFVGWVHPLAHETPPPPAPARLLTRDLPTTGLIVAGWEGAAALLGEDARREHTLLTAIGSRAPARRPQDSASMAALVLEVPRSRTPGDRSVPPALNDILGWTPEFGAQMLARERVEQLDPALPRNGVTFVDHDLRVSTLRGRGLLYVRGDLDVRGALQWKGLVYVEGRWFDRGDSWILGSVVVADREGSDAPVRFEPSVPTVLYSREALEKLLPPPALASATDLP